MFCVPCSKFNLIDLGTTLVCRICGRETKQGPDPRILGRVNSNAPLFITHYSRTNRFLKLFDDVVLPHPTLKDAPMLEYLDTRDDAITEHTLLSCMAESHLPDKRYSALHLFTRVFCKSYQKPLVPPTRMQDRKILQQLFSDIEFSHRKTGARQFFNYAFLLRHILKNHPGYEPFLKYIKKIKCKKRRKRYVEMYDRLKIDYRFPRFQACDQSCDASAPGRGGDPYLLCP